MTRRRERNFSHARDPLPADDPQVLQVVGQIAADACTSRALVLTAAQILQDAADDKVACSTPIRRIVRRSPRRR